MSPPFDKRETSRIKPAESQAVTASEQNSPHGNSAGNSESFLGELWHSTKYAFVQSPYDAVRQEANHLAGAITKGATWLPEHQFVEPVHARNDFSAVGIAQDVGSAIGTLPYLIGAQAGLRKLLPEKMIAESVPLLAGEKTQNVMRTAMAGGLVGGVLTPVADDDHWAANKFKVGTTDLVTFAVAGAGLEYLGKGTLAGKLSGGAVLSDKLMQSSLERGTKMTVGGISGGVGSFVGNETSSLIFDHKLAEGSSLGPQSLKTAAMMATLSALGRPGSANAERVSGIPDVQMADVKTGEVAAERLASDIRRPGSNTSPGDESTPRPMPKTKPRVLDDLDPRPDANQAIRLETQASQYADKGQFGQSAQRLAAAVDCLETLKSQGGAVDAQHLTELYRRLSSTRQQADERGQTVPIRK